MTTFFFYFILLVVSILVSWLVGDEDDFAG